MKFLRFITIAVLVSIIFASCDKVECPACGKNSIPINGDTIFKKVLLEDYTAFKCVNCPEAAAIAHELKNLYGDRLVILGIHVGIQAWPTGGLYTYDFRTVTGDAWEAKFKPISGIGLPAGMINRKGYPVQSSYLIGRGDWGTEVSKIILDPADANIELFTVLDTATKQLDVSLDAYFYKQLKGTFYISVCVIEDNINEPQVTPRGDSLEYLHMHVLRGAVNGTWGDSLVTNPLADSTNFISKQLLTYTLTNYRDFKNCSIVAFIYRKDTPLTGELYGQYEIVQTEEVKPKLK